MNELILIIVLIIMYYYFKPYIDKTSQGQFYLYYFWRNKRYSIRLW